MNNETKFVGRFEIWGTWPEELLPLIMPLLEKYEPDLPPWCQIAHVGYDVNMNCAECGVDFEYRRIRLSFGPRWFTGIESEREMKFVHELMHGYAHHLHNVAWDLIGDLTPANEQLRTLARKTLREANEGITTDLTDLALRLKNKQPTGSA